MGATSRIANNAQTAEFATLFAMQEASEQRHKPSIFRWVTATLQQLMDGLQVYQNSAEPEVPEAARVRPLALPSAVDLVDPKSRLSSIFQPLPPQRRCTSPQRLLL